MVTQPRSMAQGHREGPRARGLLHLDTLRPPRGPVFPPSWPWVLSAQRQARDSCMLAPGCAIDPSKQGSHRTRTFLEGLVVLLSRRGDDAELSLLNFSLCIFHVQGLTASSNSF